MALYAFDGTWNVDEARQVPVHEAVYRGGDSAKSLAMQLNR